MSGADAADLAKGVAARNMANPKPRLSMIHFGRKVPKALAAAGWKEVYGIHMGKGQWALRLEKPAP
jgi:hypothetical protein